MNQRGDPIDYFERQIDVAYRYALEPYDDGRKWFLCSDTLDLALAAEVLATNRLPAILGFFQTGQLTEHRSFKAIEGEKFECIYFDNAYVLKRAG